MHRGLLLSVFFFGLLFFAHSQSECFSKFEKAFAERGATIVPDAMHKNVVICFFNKERMGCYCGKVRVEGGKITAVFLQYSDDSYVLYEDPFYNTLKKAPIIKNGISEMIYSAKGETFKIVFIDQLKPKTSGQMINKSLILSSNLSAAPFEKEENFDLTFTCWHLDDASGVQYANKNLIFTPFTEAIGSMSHYNSVHLMTLI
ncbi:MAG: hypothetical protein RL632_1862 [Bacteroidota bacterium]|jgi:hypothetical protein